ncbi:MAG: DUF3887 domain-containing protein [Propionibacteriaceae bacterium]|jgi:hypothetical protein|nr:DUF3887 domain-containing protein [Propionibacteriaceae bacterium]
MVALRQAADGLLAAPVLANPDDHSGIVKSAINLRTLTENVIVAAIQRARQAGASWKEIGDALGVSRQAAFQRYGKPIDPRTGEPMNTTPLPEAAALAKAVIDDLACASWSSVTARFDAAMKDGLSPEALAAAWAQVIGQVGSFESYGTPEVVRAADVTVTNTQLNYEAGEFTARIVFRDDQSIAGLFILTPKAT